MRINLFIASATGLSRRAADKAIDNGRITINGQLANLGDQIGDNDRVKLDGQAIKPAEQLHTVILNKPVGYVCSREGQGSRTIYDLLPDELHNLKPVGRLDKDSSGLLLMTNDGQQAHELTHPSFTKQKVYEVSLDKALDPEAQKQIIAGVQLEDGLSRLKLAGGGQVITVVMSEGRNRQIRRTFEALGYQVTRLHRLRFGNYDLGDLGSGKYIILEVPKN
jgi:23S rRNA pseudouridine2605 synthase